MDNKISDSDLKKLFSEKLVMLRKESGQTMEATADGLDLDKSEYFRFLKGQRLPHLLTLLRLSKKYGVTLDWWFNSLNDPPGTRQTFKQRSFELQGLSLLKKVEPPLHRAVLAALKAFVQNV
ncbi:MAG: helix-turn-helix domain-containing protein [Candidatus Margulisbacteria bacterium]|jgi:transcriptional regulator with XRE-family HTH domain|nr:helix-turn-helix domain-containing protein [Candidatus Margulisiibacteriota bacterium]